MGYFKEELHSKELNNGPVRDATVLLAQAYFFKAGVNTSLFNSTTGKYFSLINF